MVLINYYGPPGAGKSTAAAFTFSYLKMKGINAEYVDEYAKGKVWEGNQAVFKNQAYIFGKQFYKISRLENDVDVVVTDSLLLFSILYNEDDRLGDAFNSVVRKVNNSYDAINFLVLRDKKYNPKGRHQSQEESDALLEPIKNLLKDANVDYSGALFCENSFAQPSSASICQTNKMKNLKCGIFTFDFSKKNQFELKGFLSFLLIQK